MYAHGNKAYSTKVGLSVSQRKKKKKDEKAESKNLKNEASVFMALTLCWLSPKISVEQCVEAKCSALLLGHTLSLAKYARAR